MGLDDLRDLIQADVELYVGSSMHGRIERAKSMGTSIAKGGPGSDYPSTIQTRKLEIIKQENILASEFANRHSMYQFPRFDEDPGALEGLFLHARAEDED